MAKRRKTFSETIRHAVRESGQSLGAISRATGIDISVLSRFMRGERGIEIKTIAKLCAYLGLELRARKRK